MPRTVKPQQMLKSRLLLLRWCWARAPGAAALSIGSYQFCRALHSLVVAAGGIDDAAHAC